MDYVWLKALHVAAVLVWTGGLLAQSLTVAGAAGAAELGPGARVLIARIRAWDRRVTSPALLIVWGLGLALAASGGWFVAGWLWVKLALVLFLSGLHGVQAGMLRRLASGAEVPTGMRWTPTASAASLAAIALLVVSKAF